MDFKFIDNPIKQNYSSQFCELLKLYNFDYVSLGETSCSSFFEKNICNDTSLNGVILSDLLNTDFISKCDYINQPTTTLGPLDSICFLDEGVYGFSTNYFAFSYMMGVYKFSIKDESVLILGDNDLVITCQNFANDCNAKTVEILSYDKVDDFISSYYDSVTCIINAGASTPSIALTNFKKLKGVFDLNYIPLSSDLILNGNLLGITAGGGLPFIISKLILSSAIFTATQNINNFKVLDFFLETKIKNSEFISSIDLYYKEALLTLSNIVIIGMPGSGKSSLGAALSDYFKKPLLDIDSTLKEKYNLNSSDLLSINKTPYLKQAESSLISKISSFPSSHIIIASDSSILKKESVFELKKNGVFVFLNTPLNCLFISDDSFSIESLHNLYFSRIKLYNTISDFSLFNCAKGGFTPLCSELHSYFQLD